MELCNAIVPGSRYGYYICTCRSMPKSDCFSINTYQFQIVAGNDAKLLLFYSRNTISSIACDQPHSITTSTPSKSVPTFRPSSEFPGFRRNLRNTVTWRQTVVIAYICCSKFYPSSGSTCPITFACKATRYAGRSRNATKSL